MENNQQSFWQFSDQLRLHTSNLANLSLNDSIWSTNYVSKHPDQRRNFDITVGGSAETIPLENPKAKASGISNVFNDNSWKTNPSSVNDFTFGPVGSKPLPEASPMEKFKGKVSGYNNNPFNEGWKFNSPVNSLMFSPASEPKSTSVNGGFNKGIYPSPKSYGSYNVNLKGGYKNKGLDEEYASKGGKKSNKKNQNHNKNEEGGKDGKSSAEKRFKTLPPSEALPRNETIGGYIFVCNNDTMEENLKRQLFGLPPRYRDSVRAITPGLPLFLYNYSTHQLHGIYEAASFGGTNIDPKAWEDKKCPGESRFPAQVRAITRKVCEPLEEDSFRPILHHYDGPKFRLELSVPEALSLLDIFAEQSP
ncbi:PREDICTED: B2 protein [Tarenaya hassleriana]|uniref:B2 protein n=1 Tax=Tarenaya hassleriana TaxID=28532 RepID=UPI00053C5D36|nr:PREDICTED: B2 protein [Tarenaya hassleriana]